MPAQWWRLADLRLQVPSKGGSLTLANCYPKGVSMWDAKSSQILRDVRNLYFYVQSTGF